jgi:hypothetical protein
MEIGSIYGYFFSIDLHRIAPSERPKLVPSRRRFRVQSTVTLTKKLLRSQPSGGFLIAVILRGYLVDDVFRISAAVVK